MDNGRYFIGKEKRIVKAHKWYEKMKSEYQDDIMESVKGTRHYKDPQSINVVSDRCEESEIEFLNTDTVSAIMYANTNEPGKICALNFASYKRPGGMFLNGSSAQEESLCHESTLYNVLELFRGEFYEPNKKRLNKALYNDNMLYSPNIIFIQESKPTIIGYSDIITCAAPNKGAAQQYQGVSNEKCKKAMINRIESVLKVAYSQNVDVLILGAFGCGVFKNDPIDVATIFHTMLNNKYKKCFKKVIFAIPSMNKRDATLDIFKRVFDSLDNMKGE